MHEINHLLKINTRKEKVYDAVTTGDGLQSWWTKTSKGNPILKEIYQFYFSPEFDWAGVVIELIPNEKIVWKMTRADEDWTDTELGFELQEEEDATKVYFFHRKWKTANDHFKTSSYCWAAYLKCLADFVEKGKVVPYEQRF